ncbi:MAG: hypothetical protein Q9183_000104 [Haloplaca sp. 2 TL-2023]
MVHVHYQIATELFVLLLTLLVYVGTQPTVTIHPNPSSSSLPSPSTCPVARINDITQTLPQQCFTTCWAAGPRIKNASSSSTGVDGRNGSPRKTSGQLTEVVVTTSVSHVTEDTKPTIENASHQQSDESQPTLASTAPPKASDTSARGESPGVVPVSENDSESPLDNANFLSFEDWKQRNLAKAGQSAESLGGERHEPADYRRRPGGINNALDSLGEDTEIEIDFAGFVNAPVAPPRALNDGQITSGEHGTLTSEKNSKTFGDMPPGAHAKNKNAGTTCKERSNYASFDCAATMLKTNPECKSATSILVENKDSYMLNLCSADNKFFIVELCDVILIDTVVLANFEFFSSIFRTFRVSISDKYPVRLDKWRKLGVFEAKNSRGLQAFPVTEPQIWARYLRIEFLTHYSNEYYCPISLLRVHGTTMMEEFNHELKLSRGEEDSESGADETGLAQEAHSVEGVVTADVPKHESLTITEESASLVAPTSDSLPPPAPKRKNSQGQASKGSAPNSSFEQTTLSENTSCAQLAVILESTSDSSQTCHPDEGLVTHSLSPSAETAFGTADHVQPASSSSTHLVADSTRAPSDQPMSTPVSNSKSKPTSMSASISESTSTLPEAPYAEIDHGKTMPHKGTTSSSQSSLKMHSSATHPSGPNPTTQESFFKSVHKRLQLLESNSTLSLQYIEEQSRILRDAFTKVERRQLAKTSTFLESLNTTVLDDLRAFREQYEQIWQSTVLELSSQRQQNSQEIEALSTRLTLLADEMLFQKRISILQFTLVLLCLGLAVFSRGSAAAGVGYLEHVVNKSSINLSRYASHPDSPSGSPSSTRPASRYGWLTRGASPRSDHRRSPSEESVGDGTKTPNIEYEPPTPTSLGWDENGLSPRADDDNHHQQANGLLSADDRTASSSNVSMTSTAINEQSTS